MIKHYKMTLLRFAYLHLPPGSGLEGLIMLKPSFQRALDKEARQHLAELMDYADAHVDHSCRTADGIEQWIKLGSTLEEQRLFNKWADVLQEIPPKGWEIID